MEENLNQSPNGPKPNNGLAWAIVSTVLFCLPFGIVAIINASKVDKLWNDGKYIEAQSAASKARTWSWLAFVFGLVGAIIYFIVNMAALSQY